MPIPAGTLETLRAYFGGTIADYAVVPSIGGTLRVTSAAPTMWDAPAGGNQYTDFVLNGVDVDAIPVGPDGEIPRFQGPPGVNRMWLDAGAGRVLIISSDYAADYAAAAGESATQAQEALAAVIGVGTTNDTIVAGLLGGASATRTAGDARYARTANRPVTLKDNASIDFTGATDSAAALQAALTAAGAGTPIEFGRQGVVRCDSGLSMLLFQELDMNTSSLGAGGTAPSELRFTGISSSGVGLTGYPGGNNVIKNGIIRGPGTGAGSSTGFLSASGSPRFHGVGFYGWAIGCSLTDAFYTKFVDECEWSGNKTGLLSSGCFNLEHFGSRFNCLYNASSLGVGIDGAARGMTLHGGSIENHGSGGGVRVYAGQVLDMFGTYFESSSAASGAFGILAAGIDKATLNLYGCTVYLTETSRWLHATGSTNMVLNSWGNKFVCPNTSSSTPIAYNFTSAEAGNIKGRIGRDDWSEMLKVGGVYVPTGVLNLGQMADLDIRHPLSSYLGGDICGTGSPEGVIPGRVGALYRRLDGGSGTSLYVKESGTGTTGWVAK